MAVKAADEFRQLLGIGESRSRAGAL